MCGEKGTLLHCWWECKLVQPLWKTVWRFIKKTGNRTAFDPPIPFLGIHTEETNRMGKTGELFKKIRDTKGTFHAKMGSIKDRNGLVLTEAEDIKKRWQEYTEELYKKDLFESR